MKKTILLIFAAICMMGSANAQSIPLQTQKAATKPAMNQEINAMVGIRGNMDRSEPAAMYGGYYSAYSNKGLGFRAGFEVSPGNEDMAKYYGMPIQFLWKYGYQRSVASSLKAGVSNAAYTTVRSVLYGQKPNLERTLDNFILGLLQNMQFFAGITPCVLKGEDLVYTDLEMNEYYVNDTRTSFGMSADLGLGMSFYAGPLEIGIIPSFHYMLTGNGLNYHQDTRLYYSTVLSLGLMF